jgi:hypothetical protein
VSVVRASSAHLLCHSPFTYPPAAFTIFHSGTGNQGILGQASKQQLDSVFGTTKEDEAMKILLEKGTAQAGEGIPDNKFHKNQAQGGSYVDTRGSGKGTTGI